MGGGGPPDGSAYSNGIGAVYVFNLIVGAGALSLPNAFSQAGWLSGTLLLCVLAFFSYVTSTFMVEAMSLANALEKKRNQLEHGIAPGAAAALLDAQSLVAGDSDADGDALLRAPSDDNPGIQERQDAANDDLFNITNRGCAEMAAMAGTFFTPLGEILFYITLIVYLYGDLCIYAAAVPVSLQNVVCPMGENATGGGHTICPAFKWAGVTVAGSYYVFLVIFAVCLGPFAYVGVAKTKYLQMFTTSMRWITFLLLISLCVAGIAGAQGGVDDFEVYGDSTTDRKPSVLPKTFETASLSGTTFMFGASVYSFMCQHSLPSLVSPITDQSRTGIMLFWVFVVVALFYLLLVYSAMFRFEADTLQNTEYKGVYTLVWQQFPSRFIAVFLQMFPVFVLSTNFPIISITLRNNLITLGTKLFGDKQHPLIVKFLYPTLAIGPPVFVAFFTDDVGSLISITGSYAGTGIQYVIPAMTLLRARRAARVRLGHRSLERNGKRTPFGQGTAMIVIVLIWALICLLLVTWNHIKSIPAVRRHLGEGVDGCYHPMLMQTSGVHNLVSTTSPLTVVDSADMALCGGDAPWRGQ
eukprot:m.95945 g.95945  ORF g.95945 m.95945 type:complete len:582 (-) comp10132_c0_seq1:67-1812(-)